MKITKSIVAATAIAFFSSAQGAENEVPFEQGSVLIHCATPSGEEQIAADLFYQAWPYWFNSLQEHIDAGRVKRVYYLTKLKEGLLIIVPGEDRKTALETATAINEENTAILQKAIDDSCVELKYNPADACELIEIGPVAIKPR